MCVSVVLLSGGLAIIGFALLARFVILPSFVQHYIQTVRTLPSCRNPHMRFGGVAEPLLSPRRAFSCSTPST